MLLYNLIMIKKFILYFILICLHIINIINLYKTIKNYSINKKIWTLVNKICLFILLIVFHINYEKFIILNLKEKIIITLFYSFSNMLEILESPYTVKLLSILKEKKKYIYILSIIILCGFVLITNYIFLIFLKYLLNNIYYL